MAPHLIGTNSMMRPFSSQTVSLAFTLVTPALPLLFFQLLLNLFGPSPEPSIEAHRDDYTTALVRSPDIASGSFREKASFVKLFSPSLDFHYFKVWGELVEALGAIGARD